MLGLWVCPGDKSIPNEVRLYKFGPKMHLSTVKVPIDFRIDLSWSSVSFLTSNLLHSTKFCVSYSSTSFCIFLDHGQWMFHIHMTPHMYWFLCMRRGSRHRPWNSLVLYLGEIIAVQPVSTRRLALDFTSSYRFSFYYIHLTCRNFIYPHSAVTETTVKQRPLAFICWSPQTEIAHTLLFLAR